MLALTLAHAKLKVQKDRFTFSASKAHQGVKVLGITQAGQGHVVLRVLLFLGAGAGATAEAPLALALLLIGLLLRVAPTGSLLGI